MFSAYHQFNDRFTLCANIGWQDWSEFGKPDITISGNRTRSFTADLNYEDTYHVALEANTVLPEVAYERGYGL